jgi:ABC-2 type transport system ATP-binding protein
VAGLVRLDGGTIRLGGETVLGRAGDGTRRHLGWVPQDLALYPALTVRENLEVFGRLHGVSRADLPDRVAWALDWSGLGDRGREPAANLSGGMKRRLNIACGVLHRPAVVLLDEPTVGVDPHARQRIWTLLESLREDGAALLQSSHQLEEIQSRCDRVIVVHRGAVIAHGTMAELAKSADLEVRAIRVTADRAVPADTAGAGLAVEGPVVTGAMRDVVEELPALLRRLEAAGARVEDIHVEPPGLEKVFDRLTSSEESPR